MQTLHSTVNAKYNHLIVLKSKKKGNGNTNKKYSLFTKMRTIAFSTLPLTSLLYFLTKKRLILGNKKMADF